MKVTIFDYGYPIGHVGHLWESYRADGHGQRRYSLRESATHTPTPYGVRPSGSGADGWYNTYIGEARVAGFTIKHGDPYVELEIID